MTPGTIVLTAFPYTNLRHTSHRPAVVIFGGNANSPDVIVAFISSVLPDTLMDSDFLLPDTHPDFRLSGLKKSSIVKLDKLATLHKSIFSGELGYVSPALFELVKEKLRLVLNL
ncbi:MAG: type II toxin-antitoxin system PemK/MazF family toxin [Saprospiraceae bacterium]